MNRFAALVAWIGCAAFGCAEPGPFGASDPAIVVDDDPTTGVAVTTLLGRNYVPYTLRFAANGIRLPESLIHGEELIAGGRAPYETGVGTALYPIFVAAAPAHDGPMASPQLPGVVSTLAVELPGPAVARIRVHWDVTYVCEGEHTASGDTIFTLFPGGRIVQRDENIRATENASITSPTGSVPCGLTDPNDGAALFFTSFWSFTAPKGANRDAANRLTNEGAGGEQTSPPVAAACADWGSHKVAVQWPGTSTRLAPSDLNAFVFDFENSQATISGTPRNLVTELQLADGPESCGDVLATLAPPRLRVGDSPILVETDGIWQDPTPRTEPFTITSPDAPTPGGFAVSIQLDDLDHLRITRSPDPGPSSYLVQPDSVAGRYILWFRDDLLPGDTITVEPLAE